MSIEFHDQQNCKVPLTDIRDEGPLVAAAGFLTAGCFSEAAFECGPHAVLPALYCTRFSVELCLHGCYQALEEGRNCKGRTEQVTHNVRKLFDQWKQQMSISLNRHRWYRNTMPDLEPLWNSLKPLHELDPDGTCLRYPKNFPDYPDLCSLRSDTCESMINLVNFTAALVPLSLIHI